MLVSSVPIQFTQFIRRTAVWCLYIIIMGLNTLLFSSEWNPYFYSVVSVSMSHMFSVWQVVVVKLANSWLKETACLPGCYSSVNQHKQKQKECLSKNKKSLLGDQGWLFISKNPPWAPEVDENIITFLVI